MENKQIKFKSLLKTFRSLRLFGLNPSDWQVDRNSPLIEGEVKLHHRSDSDFRIHGDIERSPKTIGELYAIRVVSFF